MTLSRLVESSDRRGVGPMIAPPIAGQFNFVASMRREAFGTRRTYVNISGFDQHLERARVRRATECVISLEDFVEV